MISVLPIIYLLEKKVFSGIISTIFVASFLFNFDLSSDYHSYEAFFIQSCYGNFTGVIEPGYQLLSYIYGYVSLYNCTDDSFKVFTALSAVLLIPLINALSNIQFSLYSNADKNGVIIVSSLIATYIFILVFGYNFRSGFAIVFTIFAFNAQLKGKHIRTIIYLIVSISFHIQVFPFALVVCLLIVRQKPWSFILFAIIALFFASYLQSYLWYQGIAYLRNTNFSFRATFIPWLLLDCLILTLLLRNKNTESKKIMLLITFSHLLINIIFIQNSHISGRVSKAFEPILICITNIVISRNITPRYSSVIFCVTPTVFFCVFILIMDGYFVV